MTSSDLIRWGGLSGVLAGVMYTLTAVLSLLAPHERVFDSFSDYLIEVIFVVGLAGTLVAIAGLHTLHGGRYGLLGAAGSLITFIGYGLLLVAAVVTTLLGREALDAVFPIGVLAILFGSVLLGAMILRARVLLWWCGVLLIISLPLSVALDVITGGAGGLALAVVWGLAGYALLAPGSSSTQQRTSRVT